MLAGNPDIFPQLKPIYLFADSSLLFWRERGLLFLNSIRNRIERADPQAVYLGAAQGGGAEYCAIFDAAMDAVGISERRMILSPFSAEDQGRIAAADIVLLTGGDFVRGFPTIEDSGLSQIIVRRYLEGATLIGVSAGATHLGLMGWHEHEADPDLLIDSLNLVPFIVSVHEETSDWQHLRQAVRRRGGLLEGLGIPSGAGAAYHSDGSVEPIRYPVCEISAHGDGLVERMLVPWIARNIIYSEAVN
jgi:cyanophycinase